MNHRLTFDVHISNFHGAAIRSLSRIRRYIISEKAKELYSIQKDIKNI